jgi:hypothetical protein
MTKGLSIEEGIKRVYNGGRHVVILGAGASIASCIHNSEKNGKSLPSMLNLIEVVGLQDIVDDFDEELRDANFETLFSNLFTKDPDSKHLKEIELRVSSYFGSLVLPESPTIYDYLVLSLRSKDHIATFNWDPFLYQAFCRNSTFTKNVPYMSFLHGSAALGYNKELDESGPSNYYADSAFTQKFEPTKLLYPIGQKDYTSDPFINKEWERTKDWVGDENTKIMTVFGYGAPVTDLEAVDLLSKSWGSKDKRNMEQFEMINVESMEDCRRKWKKFIHTHHYDYMDSYFDSRLAKFPRRTFESYTHQFRAMTPSEAFQKANPVPNNFKSIEQMWEWFSPLIEAEQQKD